MSVTSSTALKNLRNDHEQNYLQYLKIGDYILLKQPKYHDGRLSAEGIMTEDIYLTKDDEYFYDSLWQIHVQNQYSAVKEYEEVLFSTDGMVGYEEGTGTGEYSGSGSNGGGGINYDGPLKKEELLSQLHRAAINEGRLNEKLMTMKIGKPVAFGDVIQLRHVKSNKYLTVNTNALAKQERENLRVSLDPYGDPLSWLEFMPKSKGDREGSLVSATSETYLRVHERPNEYIHCSKVDGVSPRNEREINCSLESSNSCWSLTIYHHAQDVVSKYILTGQLVSLREPETSHYIVPSQDSTRVTIAPSSILSINSDTCTVGSHLLWMIEKSPLVRGGRIGSSRIEKLVFKHLNSGVYMRVDPSSSVGTSMSLISTVNSREEASLFEVNAAQESSVGDGSVFQLTSKGMWLYAAAPVQNGRSSVMVSPVKMPRASHSFSLEDHNLNSGASPAATALVQAGFASPRRNSGQHLVSRSCVAVVDRALATYFTVSNSLQQQLGIDLFMGVEALKILRSFEDVSRSRRILHESVAGIEARIKSLFVVLESIYEFLTDDVATTIQLLNLSHQQHEGNNFDGINKNSKKILIRQTLMREQGVLSAIIDIIELCGTSVFTEIPSTVRRLRENPKGKITREVSQNQSFKKLLSQMSISDYHSNSNMIGRTSLPENDRKSFTRMRTFSSEIISQTASGLPHGRHSNPLSVETSIRLPAPEASSRDDDEDELNLDQLMNNLNSLAHDIAAACFKSLLAIIYENHSNQIHIADKFPILLNQVRDQELAVVCVQEMLRDNLQMLQTKVREREISIFLHLLEESDMNVTLLNLLRSTCSCPTGVDTTQRMVATALFQPLYNPNGRENFLHAARQLSALSDESEEDSRPSSVIRQASSVSNLSDEAYEDKAAFVRSRIISKAPKPTLLMMTPTTAYNKMRRSYVFTGAAISAEWSRNALYLPENSKDLTSIHAFSLVKDGLPKLTVSWEVGDDNAFSMMHLFNFSKEVPFEHLCNVHSTRRKGRQTQRTRRATENSLVARASMISRRASHAVRKTGRNTIAGKPLRSKKDPAKQLTECKNQIVDYFCTQLYLFADLCLDRNYVSMNIIELKFSYEMLLTILKLPYAPRRFKAPVCRLLRCLYVDRDPQVEVKYPRLIRTSLSLSGGNENSGEHEGLRYQFSLLQELISDYIHNELETQRCDGLSSEMLALLLTMMKFGFYHKIEQLKDVIFPLTRALDEHRGVSSGMGSTNSLSSDTIRTPSSITNQNHERYHFWRFFWNSHTEIGDEDDEDDIEESSIFDLFGNFFRWNSIAPDDSPERSLSFSFSSNPEEITNRHGNRRLLKKMRSKSGKFQSELTKSLADSDEIAWEEQFLNFVERPIFICFIITLVLATTAIAIFNIIQVPQGQDAALMTKADLAISIVFIAEIVLRIYCTYIVYNDILTFIINPYKLLDVSVVALDVTLLAYGSFVVGLQGVSHFAKTLRILRILRLIRLFRAARLIRKMAKKSDFRPQYIIPERYSSPGEDEIRTLRAIIQVMSVVHDRLQDQKLDSLIQHFSSWFDESIRNNAVNPTAVYQKVCEETYLHSTFPPHFGEILVDILMYSDSALVQEALRLLMLREYHEGLFIETARNVQIIYSWRLENIYKNLSAYLKDLKIHAEAFELWGNLASVSDNSVADAIISMLETIAEYLTRKQESNYFEWESSITVDPEVQQLLYNMDALSIFILLQKSIAPQNDDNNSHHKIQKIIQACNRCLSLFVEYNEINQAMTFPYLEWFMNRVGDDCDSSKVARAIISGNRALIKQCPRNYISDLFQKIISDGRRAEYLDLLIGMTDVTDEGDSGIISLRSEISRYVTNRDRAQFLITWCDSKDSADYNKRKKAMETYLHSSRPPRDCDLSPDLQYHLNLLTLIAGCKLGQKIQAVYPIEAMIDAIIDTSTMDAVKRGLGLLLLEVITDGLIGLDASEALWNYFEHCVILFDEYADTLLDYFNKESSAFRSSHADLIHITLNIICIFFTNFDIATFRDQTLFESESSVTKTHKSEFEITRILQTLYDSIKEFQKTHVQLIGPTLSAAIDATLLSLKNKQAPGPIPYSDPEMEYQTHIRNRSIITGIPSPLPDRRQRNLRKLPSLSADAIHEAFYRKQYQIFLDQITQKREDYYKQSTLIFENMLSVDDPGEAEVRLEPLLSKISNHIRTRISRSDISASLDSSAVKTSLWLIETWSIMIYKDLNLDVDQLMNPEFYIDIPSESKYQRIMNQNGVTLLCLELVAVGIEPALRVAALKLLVALLVKNGGNKDVQETIYQYLTKSESMLFFESVRDMIELMMVWCQRIAEKSIMQKKEKVHKEFHSKLSDDLPEEVVVLKVLHSMCDGGFLKNKNLIREQTGNTRLVNLLDYFGYFLDLISRVESHSCTKIGIRVLHTILGLVQGPCKGNQEHFILHTNLLSATNRIMRSSQSLLAYSTEWEKDLEILKERVLDVLLTCIEGNKYYGSVVFERIQIAMELNVLNVLIMPNDSEGHDDDLNETNKLTSLQSKYLVFLRTLISESSEIPQNAALQMNQEVLNVEVIWHSQPYTHYFHRPSVASDISESSKRRLIEEVDLSSQDTKLKDFIRIAKDLYREATHHQILKGYGILNAWDLKANLSWLMLLNCFIVNVLLVTYFTTDPDTGVRSLPDTIDVVVFSLSIFQVFLSIWNLGIYIIVRVPVIYWSFIDDGYPHLWAVLYSVTDPVFLWSSLYVALTVIAISKNSTSRDVMYAVVYPARQLLTAIIIILILVNVFAGFIFTFYGTDFDLSERLTNLTLWDTMKLVITYGVRANEGIGAYMTPSISTRMLLDMSFYLIITVVLLNIFFGIIIDTFGKLRNLKVEREAETANKCFICGVDSHDFLKDGSSAGTLSFKQHREERHNLWNYLYFAMHLWQQPRQKDSSVEMTVRLCMELGDVSWFPIGFHEKNVVMESHQYAAPPINSSEENSTDWRHRPSIGRQLSIGSVASTEGSPRRLSKYHSIGGGVNDGSELILRSEFDRMTEIMTEKLKTLETALSTLISTRQMTSSPSSLQQHEASPTTPISLQPLRRLPSFRRTSDPPLPLSNSASPVISPRDSIATVKDQTELVEQSTPSL